MYSAGVSYLLELYGCSSELLDDGTFIETVISEAVEQADATLIQQVSQQFTPHGVTALALLSESHISIHTWPEHGYAAADIFTCGRRAKPRRACEFLVRALGAERHTIRRVERGMALPESAEPKPVAALAGDSA